MEDKIKKKIGWMFWGFFVGCEKGPCLIWEKEWGSIDSEGYCQKTVPLIDGMVSMRPWVTVMQDNAPGHSSSRTREELRERLIQPISWPAFSPDLNPIEAVWDQMKDYIHIKYPGMGCGMQRSHDLLRMIVMKAWDSVKPEFLSGLIESMPSRCRAVFDADGGPTKY